MNWIWFSRVLELSGHWFWTLGLFAFEIRKTLPFDKGREYDGACSPCLLGVQRNVGLGTSDTHHCGSCSKSAPELVYARLHGYCGPGTPRNLKIVRIAYISWSPFYPISHRSMLISNAQFPTISIFHDACIYLWHMISICANLFSTPFISCSRPRPSVAFEFFTRSVVFQQC